MINLVGDESQKLTSAHNRTRKSKGLVIPCRSWEFLGNFAFWPLVTPDDNFENSWGHFAFWPLSTPDGRSLTSGDLIRSLVFTKNNKVLMVFTSHLRGFRSFTFGDLWPSSTRKNGILPLNIVKISCQICKCPSLLSWDIVFTAIQTRRKARYQRGQNFYWGKWGQKSFQGAKCAPMLKANIKLSRGEKNWNLKPFTRFSQFYLWWPQMTCYLYQNSMVLSLIITNVYTKYEKCQPFLIWDIAITSSVTNTHTQCTTSPSHRSLACLRQGTKHYVLCVQHVQSLLSHLNATQTARVRSGGRASASHAEDPGLIPTEVESYQRL